MKKYFLILICAILLSGCIHPYEPTIQQGNELSSAQVNQLKLGMSKDEVQFILGTPVLTDDLNNDRWDYVYTLKLERQPIQVKHLTLYFTNGSLAKIEGDKSLSSNGQTKKAK